MASKGTGSVGSSLLVWRLLVMLGTVAGAGARVVKAGGSRTQIGDIAPVRWHRDIGDFEGDHASGALSLHP